MHELSIANQIVETVEAAARQAHAVRVLSVSLRIGALSGVASEALRFAYDIATAGTLLEGSQVDIDEVPIALYCPACANTVTLPDIQHFVCPRCGAPTADIRAGKELEIVSIEVDDAPAFIADSPGSPQ